MSVIISYVFDNRNKYVRKMFRVFSCVIYTIIINYVCTDYLGPDKSKLSALRLGVTRS